MSKNIIIQEGGTPKQMTVSKIKVNNVGSGTSLWVPEDSTTLVTKSISKNGTYEASSDNAYGYSEVTVNVAGGKGSATSSGAPTTSNGVDPGGIGSSVVGMNPTTGNEEAVGVDSGGNLVTTSLPSSIVLTVNPTKMSYGDGETIDITGATVTAKKADGTTWTNSQYPNGHIPLGELIVNPTVASGSGSANITLTWKRPGDDKALSTSYTITVGNSHHIPSGTYYINGNLVDSTGWSNLVVIPALGATAFIANETRTITSISGGNFLDPEFVDGTWYGIKNATTDEITVGATFARPARNWYMHATPDWGMSAMWGSSQVTVRRVTDTSDVSVTVNKITSGEYGDPLLCWLAFGVTSNSGYSDNSGGSESGGGGNF